MRSKRPLLIPHKLLNIFAASLTFVVVVRIGIHEFRMLRLADPQTAVRTNGEHVAPNSETNRILPNIYYIIADGYARADVLKESYNYDNADFIAFLKEKDFFVADGACSNYMQTVLSLSSSLHMRYIDDLGERFGSSARDRSPLQRMIFFNEVCAKLSGFGYKIICFPSGYIHTARMDGALILHDSWLNQFDYGMIDTTPIPVITQWLSEEYGGAHARHRERILYTLEHLADPLDSGAPVFVFAHIMSPHPPFVFGPNGESIQPAYRYTLADSSTWRSMSKDNTVEKYKRQYVEQLTFLNNRIKQAVNSILSRDDRPTIILLQADHGPGSAMHEQSADRSDLTERLAILSAFYFPDKQYGSMHKTITPVNTFRIIFNRYFQGDYPLLEDKSFFSTWSKPYEFIDVTGRIEFRGKEPSAR